jgi:hypothetical protein
MRKANLAATRCFCVECGARLDHTSSAPSALSLTVEMEGTGVWASKPWLRSRLALRIGDTQEVPLQIGPAAERGNSKRPDLARVDLGGCACGRRITGKPEGNRQVCALRVLSR